MPRAITDCELRQQTRPQQYSTYRSHLKIRDYSIWDSYCNSMRSFVLSTTFGFSLCFLRKDKCERWFYYSWYFNAHPRFRSLPILVSRKKIIPLTDKRFRWWGFRLRTRDLVVQWRSSDRDRCLSLPNSRNCPEKWIDSKIRLISSEKSLIVMVDEKLKE
jgi:hypothetical protein